MDVHVSLVGRRDLSGEIYRQLRRGILAGDLGPRSPLPPTRELARKLGVSRTTVTVAYDRLWGEGLVTSHVGAGTFVSDQVSGALGGAKGRRDHVGLRPLPKWESVPSPATFERPAEFDFRTGLPDASLFPFETWRRLMSEQLRPEAVGMGAYGHPAGHPGLRAAISRHISISRSVQAPAEDVLITSGTGQAVDIIARVLLEPGDCVAVEDPGYPPIRQLLKSHGFRVCGVPVDRHGLVVEALPQDARLVYVTPSHQYPLGMSMSLQRRLALLDWAHQQDAAIIEDDYDSEFRYFGRPIEPMQTLDPAGRVIYVGSFSKTLLPTLRLAFMVSPPSLRKALQAAKYVIDWHTPLPTQAALARYIDDGGFARQMRRVSGIYRSRHELVTTLLSTEFGDLLEVIPSAAGLHVSALARNISKSELEEVICRAADAGVAVLEVSQRAFDVPVRPGLMLGYGAISTDRIPEGLGRLRHAFDAQC